MGHKSKWSFIAAALCMTSWGCESSHSAKASPDSRTQRTQFLLARQENPTLYFAEREMAVESFGWTSDRRAKIKIFATDAYVSQLTATEDFVVDESVWPGEEPVRAHTRETPGSGSHSRITCPPTVLDRSSSDYLWSYPEIAAYAQDLAASPSGMISTTILGPAQNGNFQIVATRFGPKGGGVLFKGVPTIILVATQHAREWGAAGAAVGLMRELAATVEIPSHRPALRKLLETTAVVVVPVANPEGYEFSRTTNRSWRGNLNLLSCPTFGVDLNRNHEATWAVPAESADSQCSREVFGGWGPASERETQAIRRLLNGDGFEWPSSPVALIDYHTFSDIVVYPSGFKRKSDALGPACEFLDNNCYEADFLAMRELLGDTASHRQSPPLFVDRAVNPTAMFRRDQAPNIIYTSGGTLIDEAMYADVGPTMFSATVELLDQYTAHNIECQPDREDIMKGVVLGQMDVIQRLVGAAGGLLATDASKAWLPQRIGVVASGILSREYNSSNSLFTHAVDPRHEDVRPTLLIPGWMQTTGVSSMSGSVNGVPVTMNRLRQGVQYELFALDWAASGDSPLCPPCEISIRVGENDYAASTVSPECGRCIDLCDDSRLASSGWALKKGVRAGRDDCWWAPQSYPASLTIGPYTAPAGATHCTFSFSYRRTNYLTQSAANAFTVQRETPSGTYEQLWSERANHPYSTLAPQKLVTQTYEASELLSASKVPAFILTANDSSASGVEILDPVVYCRVGGLP